ncbi:tRNA (adenosine(37)-N6)-threonylcarbamoyltransferase complex ATPase subunit type 1 TsaE [Helicobacter mesocricetorum]|uniref:tRNA (adenosine(37)-N6)-threonylcarbamoyltransferase complex ATPase subunit type 1 TsaE n=1 Tax=Helicobacter mesocricetorum TaxID=87012 RepID=UPI000CF0F4D0|nr:tRNA (adenosine(37)-N6)-threonylcarbamoyltransferase complex ATPase subunit type 1 TsaE [Helicobacter mesocricetorum]
MQLLTSLLLKENELTKLAQTLKIQDKQGVYLLEGDLASGKTTLIKAIAQYLGSTSLVTSPTFLIRQEYDHQIYHYDFYQKDLQNLLELGFLEEIEKAGWHFIEWGDKKLAKILQEVGISFTTIKILPQNNEREYQIYV